MKLGAHLRLRSQRLWRLGVVLSPIVALAVGSGAYVSVKWPTPPDEPFHCYVTDDTPGFGGVAFRSLRGCIEVHDKVMARGLNPVASGYRGVMLYNLAGLSASQFEEPVVHFKELRDAELSSYFKSLALSIAVILLVSLLALTGLWAALLAADWVLAA
jgi:hypothetical protein